MRLCENLLPKGKQCVKFRNDVTTYNVHRKESFPSRKIYFKILQSSLYIRDVEAEAVEAFLSLWKRKRKRENSTASAST